MNDAAVTVVLVEAEKSALALTAWAERVHRKILPVAMGGCWGWRGRIGKTETASGQRADEVGPLPELHICADRDVVVALDANADSSPAVRAARSALVRTLLAMGARSRIATVPLLEGVNGPDDLYAAGGDRAITDLLDVTRAPADVAVADAKAAIEAVGEDDAEGIRAAIDAIADIDDQLGREVLSARLAAAVRGRVSKRTVADGVRDRREHQKEKNKESEEQLREAELLRRPVDPARLVADLEGFFAGRVHLPEGAALLLAYFVVNTYVFDICDTVPYICLESAVPDCGKSTTVRVIGALSCRPQNLAALSEATLFRVIDEQRPTLLIDEAESLEGQTERAKALRPILHEGYKKGAVVPRCVGDTHELAYFNAFCPKVFSAIGGVTGALLSRCHVLHMARMPEGTKLKSARIHVLRRDSKPLVDALEAYAAQYRQRLRELYDAEPDETYWPTIFAREGEIWGPLLLHARLAGPEAEHRLLDVARRFGQSKADIEAEDWQVGKTIALLGALEKLPGPVFSPGDLVEALRESEAWSLAFGKAKGADEKARFKVMAAKVGYSLRAFRLQRLRRTAAGYEYDLKAAINIIRAHVPENHANRTNLPDGDHAMPQPATDSTSCEGLHLLHGFQGAGADIKLETKDHAAEPSQGQILPDWKLYE